MADLATMALIGEAVGGLAVLTGVGYAVYELRRQRQQKQEAAWQVHAERFLEPEAIEAVRLVMTLPPGAEPRAIMADAEMTRAVMLLTSLINQNALGVHQGAIPEKVLRASDTWIVYQVWLRTAPWVKAQRRVLGPSVYWAMEWQIARFQAAGIVPAEPAADPRPYAPGDGVAGFTVPGSRQESPATDQP